MQVAFGQFVAAAHALGHVVAGELDVDAAGMGAEAAVDLEEPLHLVQHVAEPAGLFAPGGLQRVAAPPVAHPPPPPPRPPRPPRPRPPPPPALPPPPPPRQ